MPSYKIYIGKHGVKQYLWSLKWRRHVGICLTSLSSCRWRCYRNGGQAWFLSQIQRSSWAECKWAKWDRKWCCWGNCCLSLIFLLISQADWQLYSSPLERTSFEGMHVASGSELFMEKQSISCRSITEKKIRGHVLLTTLGYSWARRWTAEWGSLPRGANNKLRQMSPQSLRQEAQDGWNEATCPWGWPQRPYRDQHKPARGVRDGEGSLCSCGDPQRVKGVLQLEGGNEGRTKTVSL